MTKYLIIMCSFSLLFSSNKDDSKFFSDDNIEITFPCNYKSMKNKVGSGGSAVSYNCGNDKTQFQLTVTTIYDPSRKNATTALKGHLKALSSVSPILNEEWIKTNNFKGVRYNQLVKTKYGNFYNTSITYYIKGRGYHFMVADKRNNKKTAKSFLSSIKIKSKQ